MTTKLTRLEYGVVFKSILNHKVFLEDNEKDCIDSLLDKLYNLSTETNN
jgi:hypothetical protein